MYGDLYPDEFYKPYDPFTLYNWKKPMSNLNNEAILENLYEEVVQEATDSGDIAMMNSDDIEFAVRQRFEALS
tara:strand:- start:1395 stop:1613 length:219 start_codon:yes stop_codon:yes gene_type:complete